MEKKRFSSTALHPAPAPSGSESDEDDAPQQGAIDEAESEEVLRRLEATTLAEQLACLGIQGESSSAAAARRPS